MAASIFGNVKIVQALLAKGVNTDLKNKDGSTALDYTNRQNDRQKQHSIKNTTQSAWCN